MFGEGGGGFLFPVNSGSFPNAPGVMTKHQRATRMRRRHTLKTLRHTRPVIIQTFESWSLASHWFIPLSASSFQSSSGSLTVSVLCYLLAIRDSPAIVCSNVRHPLVDRQISKIQLCIYCLSYWLGYPYEIGIMACCCTTVLYSRTTILSQLRCLSIFLCIFSIQDDNKYLDQIILSKRNAILPTN